MNLHALLTNSVAGFPSLSLSISHSGTTQWYIVYATLTCGLERIVKTPASEADNQQ